MADPRPPHRPRSRKGTVVVRRQCGSLPEPEGNTMQAAPAPNPGLIFDTLMAHQRSAALRTAIELDLFRAIGEGPADSATLAGRCNTSERGMRILCDYLCIMGLIAKQDGIYSHTP